MLTKIFFQHNENIIMFSPKQVMEEIDKNGN